MWRRIEGVNGGVQLTKMIYPIGYDEVAGEIYCYHIICFYATKNGVSHDFYWIFVFICCCRFCLSSMNIFIIFFFYKNGEMKSSFGSLKKWKKLHNSVGIYTFIKRKIVENKVHTIYWLKLTDSIKSKNEIFIVGLYCIFHFELILEFFKFHISKKICSLVATFMFIFISMLIHQLFVIIICFCFAWTQTLIIQISTSILKEEYLRVYWGRKT